MRDVLVVVSTMAVVAATYTAILSVGTIVEDWWHGRRGRR